MEMCSCVFSSVCKYIDVPTYLNFAVASSRFVDKVDYTSSTTALYVHRLDTGVTSTLYEGIESILYRKLGNRYRNWYYQFRQRHVTDIMYSKSKLR